MKRLTNGTIVMMSQCLPLHPCFFEKINCIYFNMRIVHLFILFLLLLPLFCFGCSWWFSLFFLIVKHILSFFLCFCCWFGGRPWCCCCCCFIPLPETYFCFNCCFNLVLITLPSILVDSVLDIFSLYCWSCCCCCGNYCSSATAAPFATTVAAISCFFCC